MLAVCENTDSPLPALGEAGGSAIDELTYFAGIACRSLFAHMDRLERGVRESRNPGPVPPASTGSSGIGYQSIDGACKISRVTHVTADSLLLKEYRIGQDWVLGHFDKLEDGDVVDVRFILGEPETPKPPEISRAALVACTASSNRSSELKDSLRLTASANRDTAPACAAFRRSNRPHQPMMSYCHYPARSGFTAQKANRLRTSVSCRCDLTPENYFSKAVAKTFPLRVRRFTNENISNG